MYPCDIGYYNDGTGKIEATNEVTGCKVCPFKGSCDARGLVTYNAAAKSCPAGYYCDPATDPPKDCPMGTYCPENTFAI